MFAIFNSASKAIAAQIAYTVPETTTKGSETIAVIEDNSNGDLTFAEFADELPQGVYNGDEGF